MSTKNNFFLLSFWHISYFRYTVFTSAFKCVHCTSYLEVIIVNTAEIKICQIFLMLMEGSEFAQTIADPKH